MNNSELRKILSAVKNERRGGAPHEAWVKQNRDILMMQVRNTTDLNARPVLGDYMRHFFSIFVPAESLAMCGRAIGIFALVIGTVFGGGLLSAQAYRDAAPGDMMYKMKLAVESTQMFLAPNDDYRTRLHTEFADRRLDEVAKLAEGPAERQKLVPGVLAAFDQEVAALQIGLDKLRADDPQDVAETAKLMERKMAVYEGILDKAGAALPAASQLAVARTRDLVDNATVAAMTAIVEKHLAGDLNAPRSVVDNKFEDRIQQAEDKLDTAAAKDGQSVAPKTSQAKAAIAEAKELVKEQQYQAALSKIVEVAKLTKEVEADAAASGAKTDAVQPAPSAENKTEDLNINAPTPVPTISPAPADDAAGSGSR